MDIIEQQPRHSAAIERLLDLTFGRDRHGKTVYRLREPAAAVPDLNFVMEEEGELVATLRFWPVTLPGGALALLLGPLAVRPELAGRGIGRAMVRHGIARARLRGWRVILVVGDPKYYAPFGFTREAASPLRLPGPVEVERFQALALVHGALDGVRGPVGPAPAAGTAGLRKAGA